MTLDDKATDRYEKAVETYNSTIDSLKEDINLDSKIPTPSNDFGNTSSDMLSLVRESVLMQKRHIEATEKKAAEYSRQADECERLKKAAERSNLLAEKRLSEVESLHKELNDLDGKVTILVRDIPELRLATKNGVNDIRLILESLRLIAALLSSHVADNEGRAKAQRLLELLASSTPDLKVTNVTSGRDAYMAGNILNNEGIGNGN